MTKTVHFRANTLAGFFRTINDCVETTVSGTFDSSLVSNSIQVSGPAGASDHIKSHDFSATGTVWTHFDFYSSNNRGGDQVVLWQNAGVGVFRLHANVSTNGLAVVQPQYWNGSAWTNTGTTVHMTGSVLRRFDVKTVLGSGFEVYSSGTKVSEGSGWSGGGSTITNVSFHQPNTTAAAALYVSQVIVGDFDTRDSRLVPAVMDGNSAVNTGGTGTYTDVSETVLNETTAELVAVSGNKMGQTYAAVTVPSGYRILEAYMNARGRIDGTITDGKLGLLSSGSSTATAKTFNTGYEPRGIGWPTDPNTSTDWTQSGLNAAETYIEAV